MSFGQEMKDFVSSFKDTSRTISEGRKDRASIKYYNALADKSEAAADGSSDKSGFGWIQDQYEQMFGTKPPKTRKREDKSQGNTGEDGGASAPGTEEIPKPPPPPVAPAPVASAVNLSPTAAVAQASTLPLAGYNANNQAPTQIAAVDENQYG